MLNNLRKFQKIQNQVFVAALASIPGLLLGCGDGWVSPALIVLLSDDTPLISGPLTLDELSWIGSINNIGIGIGTILFVIIANELGRKQAITLLAIPCIICWALVYWGKYSTLIIVSQLFHGIMVGGTLLHLPLFIGEVSDDCIRGILGSFLSMLYNVGILFTFIMETYLQYETVALIFLFLPVVFFLLFIWIPETPQFLLKNRNYEEAENSLKFYKNCYGNIEGDKERFLEEWDKVENYNENVNISKEKLSWADFCTPQARLAFYNGINIVFCCMLSALILLSYVSIIIKDSGSIISPNESSIIVAAIQVIGGIIAVLWVDKIGRRLLIMLSIGGSALGQMIIGAFSYCSRVGIDMTDYSWIPIVGLALVFFASSLGLMPLRFIVIMELMPLKIRLIGMNVCIYVGTVVLMVASKIFPIALDALGLDVALWILSTVLVAGLTFAMIFLPETKGKNINS